ncbi:MarR family transcriptional regulator [Sulfolobus acidocaldarius]|uniref:Conserved conjugative plasmid protein n=4 Tax=Sulfolobus acidocaldarius TaxID=2285 RepID=Q4JBD5_SULAC|nr:MarR family transcriptional regulator [Sulfolobus acidocaldarius]AAY79894.1 conserved conjugative plasmid protein [Sulfolobus acidocaldarius DSM 639]AGE70458.1 conjugative plasmid protein [Sulfolobus acidocaldarius N8]AGE72732.1 conjugative plasmid protein [Sulfolobus acidocaldarius Ron12/I]ALU29162.1 conjugal transfer protein [Sulfolobus acidocaldarius]ALU31887.1 conjugal transfer protein [Sulfolobus acidocaldarius]
MERTKIGKNLDLLLSPPLRLLLLIYSLGEATVSQLIKESGGMSASTITKYVRQLEGLGLVSVELTSSPP